MYEAMRFILRSRTFWVSIIYNKPEKIVQLLKTNKQTKVIHTEPIGLKESNKKKIRSNFKQTLYAR